MKTIDEMDIASQVKSIILSISSIPDRQYADTASFKEELGFDSLDMIEMIMTCERDFYISLPDKEWKHLDTPQELTHLIQTLRS